MVPLEAAHGGALPPSAGRRYIGCEEHMLDSGTSVSFAGQHGYGKRHVKAPQEESLDLFNRNGDVDDRLWGRNGPVARGPSPRRREVTHTTWQGQDSPEAKVVSRFEMKSSIEECLAEMFGITVADAKKWEEAKVEHNGISWVVHTLNLEAVSLSKEGSTAKAIAEKLSTMPMTELRHFGLRFMVPEKEVKEAEDVQPFQSQGVPPGRSKVAAGAAGLTEQRSLEESRKRYISSGKDSFKILCQSQVDAPQGGRRFIGTRDNLASGVKIKDDVKDRGFVPMRRAGYAMNHTSDRLW
ncbi:unnamed protein product [Durusdinium trenchii]|uniref:Uncharacterized protein n=2 Tax=Durusdinium trenchii TaxID=1381693 RepID=A0ABP0RIU4_9DINO